MTYKIAYLDSSDGVQKERDSTPEETSARDIFVADSLSSSQAAEAIKAVSEAKLTGIEILGVMCSATKEDQNGLAAVALATTIARMGSSSLPDTLFSFANGNTLVVTNANFDTVYPAWMAFRQSFFTP